MLNRCFECIKELNIDPKHAGYLYLVYFLNEASTDRGSRIICIALAFGSIPINVGISLHINDFQPNGCIFYLCKITHNCIINVSIIIRFNFYIFFNTLFYQT